MTGFYFISMDDGARVGVRFGEGEAVHFDKLSAGVRRGVVVNGGNEFPSQCMEVLRTGTDDGARVEKPSTNEEPRINER